MCLQTDWSDLHKSQQGSKKEGDSVRDVQVSPDGHCLITACQDKTARLFSARTLESLDKVSFLNQSPHTKSHLAHACPASTLSRSVRARLKSSAVLRGSVELFEAAFVAGLAFCLAI